MITLVWSNRFIKAVKKARKKNPEIIDQIELVLENLEIDPFQPSLKTHKLKGILAGCWACSVEYDYRIVFEIHKSENGSISEILLLSIGTHDEVY
jgi:addiction module RelE/StbE family toxin